MFRDAAERAIAAAEHLPAPPRWLFGARHKVALRCAGDAAAAAEIAVRYRQTEGSGYCGGLNNDAWYTVLRLDTLGRSDSLAMALAEEMQRTEGVAMDFGHQDTVAQVLFSSGRLQEAVELHLEGEEHVPPPSPIDRWARDPDFADGIFALVDVDLDFLADETVRVNISSHPLGAQRFIPWSGAFPTRGIAFRRVTDPWRGATQVIG